MKRTLIRPSTNQNQQENYVDYANTSCSLLDKIKHILEHFDIRAISFDFFDTFVCRLSDTPTPLFIEVGRRLKHFGLLKQHLTEYDFKSIRIVAESKARQHAYSREHSYEVKLRDIYKYMRFVIKDIDRAMKIELETEFDFCFLNPHIADVAIMLHQSRIPIGILSDTYLSSDNLRQLLAHNGFPTDILSFIFVSSEHKVSKSTGKLFTVLLNYLNCRPESLLHIGDNIDADVKGASIAQVKAIHYPRITLYESTVFMRERSLTDRSIFFSSSFNSFRSIASRLEDNIPTDYKVYFRLGAFLFGPCLARFSNWAVQQMLQEGIKHGLVFMREAYTLLPLFQQYSLILNLPLTFIPFYVSRHAVNLASLTDVSPEQLFIKSSKRRRPTPRIILQSFELPYKTIEEIPQNLMDEPLTDIERYSLCKLMAGLPKYKYKLMVISAHKRKSFLRYFLQLTQGQKKVALIDIGFRGSIQASIDTILKYEGLDIRTTGLYLSTNTAAANHVLNGSDIRSFLGNLGAADEQLLVFMKHPEALECGINAPIGTTLGYTYDSSTSTWQPLLETVNISEDQIKKKVYIREGILAFSRIWLPFLKSRLDKGAFVSNAWLDELDHQCAIILRRLFAFPTSEEAAAFGSLYHEDNDGTNTGDFVVSLEFRERFKQDGIEGLLRGSPVYWPQGVIAVEAEDIYSNVFKIFNLLNII